MNSNGDLPIVDVSPYVETPPLAEMVKMGDQVVRARLLAVNEGYRFAIPEEDRANSTEFLGLVFEVTETYLGDVKPGEQITVESLGGYRINGDNKERTAILSPNRILVDTWKVGAEFVFAYQDSPGFGLQFRSGELVAVLVGDEGLLLPISNQGSIPELRDVKNVSEIPAIVDAAVREAGGEVVPDQPDEPSIAPPSTEPANTTTTESPTTVASVPRAEVPDSTTTTAEAKQD